MDWLGRRNFRCAAGRHRQVSPTKVHESGIGIARRPSRLDEADKDCMVSSGYSLDFAAFCMRETIGIEKRHAVDAWTPGNVSELVVMLRSEVQRKLLPAGGQKIHDPSARLKQGREGS